MRVLPVDVFFRDRREIYDLELLTEKPTSAQPITVREINRPGMCLAGFTGNFLHERIQILGETEIHYLQTLTPAEIDAAVERLVQFPLVCIVICKRLQPPEALIRRANERGIPVLRTPKSTTPFIHSLTEHLTVYFAPRESVHASLADVYGVGLLFTGRSGIGKSETALDLVERGHRLVADDVVEVMRKADDVLIGTGRKLLEHCMEIRGIGVIDVRAVFGINAIRIQKRIEVVVQLDDWETAKEADRTGLAREETTILDVVVPRVIVPLNPGKNITVISEVVAMMHLLRYSGVDVAAAFNARLIKRMKDQRGVREYLQEDYE